MFTMPNKGNYNVHLKVLGEIQSSKFFCCVNKAFNLTTDFRIFDDHLKSLC